ncbi:MAG: M1 family metallopeptidase, partial [Deltaproteobacteria bacterium]|nr:M1 family metallopeptidase [Deltaproteobacteria bacterium]
EVEWSSQLPDVVERTGYAGDFHLAGQWFPKIARLEPSGTWVHFPFHPHAEFYADFGEYDVTLDVPSRMVVGATGERVTSELVGDRRRDRYVARDVHDFAFTAWPDFVTVEEQIDGVHATVLSPRGQRAATEATLRALRHGLPFLGARFGRYPYPTLTVVHPPDSAPAAGGMEYPGFITTGGPVLAAHATSFIERITLHELAHQWFQGLVATDEHRHPALDEGLASYAESLALRSLEGPGDGLRLGGLEVSGDAWFRALAARAEQDGPVGRAAAEFATFQELAGLVYARTATALETIARTWGEDLLVRAVGRYARRHRFDHPGPRHLLAAIREVVGEDAAEVLRAVLVEGATIDFAVEAPRTLPLRAAAGVFDEGGKRKTRAAAPPSGRHLGRVLVRRRGALRVPVVIELEFEDGTRERRPWDARATSVELELESASPLVAAVVDPELHVPLDADLSNNSATRRPGGTSRLVERAAYVGALAASVLGP